jgi:hypothetical protein
MLLNQYPHVIFLTTDPSLHEKLSANILSQIKFFEMEYNLVDAYQIKGGGKFKENGLRFKAQAFQDLVKPSELIVDYINEYITNKTAEEAAAAQATAEAAKEAEEIKEEIIEVKEEFFTDLEEFIQEEAEEERKTQRLLFVFTDTVKVIKNVPNPNFNKKYKMEGDKRIYEDGALEVK